MDQQVDLATLVEGDSKLLFQLLQHRVGGEGAISFPGLLHTTLGLYLIMLSVKQSGINYRFLSLCYDSTKDWSPVSWTKGKRSTH